MAKRSIRGRVTATGMETIQPGVEAEILLVDFPHVGDATSLGKSHVGSDGRFLFDVEMASSAESAGLRRQPALFAIAWFDGRRIGTSSGVLLVDWPDDVELNILGIGYLPDLSPVTLATVFDEASVMHEGTQERGPKSAPATKVVTARPGTRDALLGLLAIGASGSK